MDTKRTTSVFPVLGNAHVHTTTNKTSGVSLERALAQVSFYQGGAALDTPPDTFSIAFDPSGTLG